MSSPSQQQTLGPAEASGAVPKDPRRATRHGTADEPHKAKSAEDLSRARAAHLGSWRQVSRQVVDVVANLDNAAIVVELRSQLEERWRRYERGHQKVLDSELIAEKKKAKFDREFEEHREAHEAGLQTLENVLIRDIAERRNRSGTGTPALTQLRGESSKSLKAPTARSTPLRAPRSGRTDPERHASVREHVREWIRSKGILSELNRGEEGASPTLPPPEQPLQPLPDEAQQAARENNTERPLQPQPDQEEEAAREEETDQALPLQPAPAEQAAGEEGQALQPRPARTEQEAREEETTQTPQRQSPRPAVQQRTSPEVAEEQEEDSSSTEQSETESEDDVSLEVTPARPIVRQTPVATPRLSLRTPVPAPRRNATLSSRASPASVVGRQPPPVTPRTSLNRPARVTVSQVQSIASQPVTLETAPPSVTRTVPVSSGAAPSSMQATGAVPSVSAAVGGAAQPSQVVSSLSATAPAFVPQQAAGWVPAQQPSQVVISPTYGSAFTAAMPGNTWGQAESTQPQGVGLENRLGMSTLPTQTGSQSFLGSLLPPVVPATLPPSQGGVTSQMQVRGGLLSSDLLPVINPVLPESTLQGNLSGVPNRLQTHTATQQGGNVSQVGQPTATSQAAAAPGVADILALAHLNAHLPSPELMVFDGQAKNWSAFIANFGNNVASKVADPALRLSYLIQHCSGEAKKAIQDLVVLPAELGYATAIATLKKRFGSKHSIAKSYVDGVRSGPRILPNDVEGLLKYSSDLNLTFVVLSQLQYASDINSTETMTSCVKRLPFNLVNSWVKQAPRISLNQDRDPNFYDLVKFVEAHAEVANTYYGRENAKLQAKHYTSTQGKKAAQQTTSNQPKAQTMATQAQVNNVEVAEATAEPPKAKKRQRRRKRKGKTDDGQSTESTDQPVVAAVDTDGATANQDTAQPVDIDKTKACPFCKVDSHKLGACRKFKQRPVQERLDVVQRTGWCFRCLGTGHFSKECDKVCSACQRFHHECLHDYSRDKAKTVTTGATQVTVNSGQCGGRSVWLSVVPVVLHGKDRDIQTHAFIDSGSNSTLINKELLQSLGVDRTPVDYSIRTVSSNEHQGEQFESYVDVSAVDGSETVSMLAHSVEELPMPLNGDREDMDGWPHLRDIVIPEVERGEIGLLIGMDVPELQWSLEERRGERGEPFARRTLFGWTIVGPTGSREQSTSRGTRVVDVNVTLVDPLRKALEQQWNHDFGDLDSTQKESMSVNDRKALKIMEDTVAIVNGKYRLAIPWKVEPETLPNNRRTAEVRLKHLKRKLEGDSKLHEQYVTTVEKYIADGHARQLKAKEVTQDSGGQWFLPHHPVFKKSNPSKCRVVFDCAAKYKGTSLNDAIHQGPNLMNSLAGVLIRFRREQVAIVGDIEAMFHQCYVTERDQRFLRFLWWENGDLSQEAKVYCMTVHLFGATSSPSVAAFCMRKTANDNRAQVSAEAVETLERSFYVDDMLHSTATEDQALSLYREMVDLLAKGGFRLTKFLSTSRKVLAGIPEDDRAKSVKLIDLDDSLPQETALGLQWSVEDDCFTYKVDFELKPLTKRGLLSMTASLYDPLGFVGPIALVPKLTQQELCRRQLDWDDKVPDDLTGGVEKWLESLHLLNKVKLPRCIRPRVQSTNGGRLELHCFSDASEYAYGAAVYCRYVVEGTAVVSLLMAKSRVAPLKLVSIPRLELTAALVSCKLQKFVVEELDRQPDEIHFWTDSTTVLRYLENRSARYKTFVAHRVLAVQQMSEVKQWHYVPTKVNPADHASRGIWANEDGKLATWLQGPEFLKEEVEDYSKVFPEPGTAEHELEIRVNLIEAELSAPATRLLERYGSYHRLCKAVAWMIKFAEFMKKRKPSKEITVEDLTAAEMAVVRCVQKESFPDEVEALAEGQQVAASSRLRSLDVFMDEQGVLRVGGRLGNSESGVERHPIVLAKHVVTTLIIRQLHERNAHVGANQTLSLVRKKYFIVRGYSVVKGVLRNCVGCKRLQGKTAGQKMSDLPAARTEVHQPPFTNVGVDYFGPLTVKFRRGTVKRWGCLFTCLVTRAVHVEIAHSMTSDSFLMAFHRFMARRGKPNKVYSDNGSNLVAAEQELKAEISAINSQRLQDEMLVEGISWHFIPPQAPHMGGVWERMVRGVKSAFRALLTHRLLTDEELLTFMTEAEKIVNDRPLTTVSSDPKDVTPLTPSDLLLLRGNSCRSQIAGDNPLRTRWAVVQALGNSFYERFLSEYLPSLQERTKWTADQRQLKVNDVVLVVDPSLPRGQWPLGLVVEPLVSEDGRVRAARVKFRGQVLRRPAAQLVFLEAE